MERKKVNAYGRFVWHDLISTDIQACTRFYTELFGWDIQEQDLGQRGKYQLASIQGKSIAGMVALDPEERIESHWMGHILVQNVDKSVGKAADLGAKVELAPTEIPDIGRYAVIEDRQGASVSLLQKDKVTPYDPKEVPGFGAFCWDELSVPNPDAAAPFYNQLFNWKAIAQEAAQGKYWIFQTGDVQVAGLMELPQQAKAQPGYWLGHLLVKDVNQTFEKARQLGARIEVQPTDVPNVGRYFVMRDPSGARVAAFQWMGPAKQ